MDRSAKRILLFGTDSVRKYEKYVKYADVCSCRTWQIILKLYMHDMNMLYILYSRQNI